MIKDNRLYYEDGFPIEFGDRISVKLPDDNFTIVHLTEFPVGMMQQIMPDGRIIQQPQMAQGFIQLSTKQQISPEFLAECKLYEVIDTTGEENEENKETIN